MDAIDAYQASIRMIMAADEMERIDHAILRVEREIQAQMARKRDLLFRRYNLECVIKSPLREKA